MIDASRYFRRPEFWPTVITVLAVGVLLSLGAWQMKRLAWKETMLAHMSAAKTEAPLTALPTDIAEFPAMEFRKVVLRGHFLHDHEFHLTPRYHQGTFGYRLLTPFVLAGDKRTVLVDRGFVPRDKREQSARPQSLVKGKVAVKGRLRQPYPHALATPRNRPQANLWFWADLPAMERASRLELLPVVVQTVNVTTPGGLPISSDGEVMIHNDHRMYAVTWFTMAGILLIVYAAYHRRRGAA